MAVDYSILSRVPSIGSRIISGMEAGRESAIRNQLLARQNLQFEQAQEDRRRALQREQQVQGLYRQAADVLRQYGKNPDDPQVLQEGVAKATEAGNMQMAQIFTGMLADAQKRQQERAYRAEYEQKYGGGAAAGTPAAAAPAGMPPASPKITSTLIDQGARQPDVAPPAITAAQSFPVAPLAGTPTETPMAPTTNALAAAPAARGANALAAPADPYAAQRDQALLDAASPNPLIANRGKMMLQQFPKLAMPGADKPVVVGGRLVDSQTGRVVYEPPPGEIKPQERYVPVGPNVFDRVTQKYLPPPTKPSDLTAELRAEAASRRADQALQLERQKFERGGFEGLTVRERQAREAKYPQATLAVKDFESSTGALIKDLETLKNHPGLDSITGFAAGRLPGITADGRAAESLLEKILSRGQFQELQKMRQASPTGGALGNVSDTENKALRAAFAALDRKQDKKDFVDAIDDALSGLSAAKSRVREAYDLTYEYRQGLGEKAKELQPGTPARQKLSQDQQEALNWANANPADPRAKTIKQRLGVQ